MAGLVLLLWIGVVLMVVTGMRMRSQPRSALLDRREERAALDDLLRDLRSGLGRALVVRGEAGVGKSALLEYLVGAAADMRVARAAGVESEMELAFAGLHLLCLPLLDRLERLPAPQREALQVAFGLHTGGAPDRFMVAVAVLTLLSEVAEERALLCVVDDAQWLDQASAQVLAFAARRLLAEPVGLVFATREPGAQLRGLADLEVHGLPDKDARALLRSVVPFRLDERVQERILAETAGNPLALLELPRGLGPAQLAGGFGLPWTQAVPVRIEQGFRRRLEALPADAQSLMLVAAAEPVGDPTLLVRAAERLGIPRSAAVAAQADGLLEVGTRVRFRHPLVRSAVYSAASVAERQAAHLALAEVTDRDRDSDRRAWHLAAAAPAPREDVAAELERSAGRARARGGMAAAAAFLQRAAELTSEPARRSERALAAAQANLQAGVLDTAAVLATAARPQDELQRALIGLLRGQIALAAGETSDAAALLVAAARQLEPLNPALARQTYLDAWTAAMFAGQFASGADLHAVSRAARSAPAPPVPPRPSDVLLDGFAVLVTEGRAQAAPLLRRAARIFAEDQIPFEESLRWGWTNATNAAVTVWEEEYWRASAERQLQPCREEGLLAPFRILLDATACQAAWRGDLSTAASLVAEAEAIAAATGTRFAPYAAVYLSVLRGEEGTARPLIDAVSKEARAAGQGIGIQWSQWAAAILDNGLGRYDQALEAAREASDQAPELFVSAWALIELVEAASRTGQTRLAADALGRLAEATSVSQTDWAQGIYARSRALVRAGEDAEGFYLEAVDRLGRIAGRPELARSHLLYGEWLRRQGRRTAARAQLRAAHNMFTAIGMDAFADRARRELLATGDSVRRRPAAARDQLTPQEAQIARLAGKGMSNAEIAAQLFLSARTIEWHLRKVFAKLDISSRRELTQVLPDGLNGG